MLNVARNQYVQKGANSLKDLFFYIFEGHIIVDLGRWLILYCGRISEPAMLLATLWITATFVTPELTSQLVIQGTLTSLSLIAFSLLPEVILFSAIIKTLKHWQEVVQNKKSLIAWSWAILYTLPTATFFGMTVYTIGAFVSSNGHLEVATGWALVWRCLAGWFYSLVGLIHAGMNGKKSDVSSEQKATEKEQEIADLLRAEIEKNRTEIDSLHTRYASEMARLQSEHLEQMRNVVTSDVKQEDHRTLFTSEQVLFDDVLPNTEPNDFTFSEYAHLSTQSEREYEDITEQESEHEEASETEQSSEQLNEREQDTEPLSVPNKKGRSSARKKRTPVSPSEQKVRTFLKRNPNAGPTLVAQQTGISKSYVSELITRVKQVS